MQIKKKYLFLNKEISKLYNLFFPDLLTPKGVPHELHTNLPDKERSALKL